MKTTFEMTLGLKLAQKGEQENNDIANTHAELVQRFQGADYFSIAISHAFTWTGHAIKNDRFFEVSMDYLKSGNLTSLDETKQFAGRFGTEMLLHGLQSWRNIINYSRVSSIQNTNAQGLHQSQEHCLEIAYQLLNQGLVFGIGPWLFCAPFKIVAVYRRELWGDPALDEVLMPLGLEVKRGVIKLIRHGTSWTEGIDESMIKEEEGGLIEGIGTVILVQDASKKIAQSFNSRVIHINSGLHLYGREEL